MAESASAYRQRKCRARAEALLHKTGYFQSKASQRRLLRMEEVRAGRRRRALMECLDCEELPACCPLCDESLLERGAEAGRFSCGSCGACLPQGRFSSPGHMEEEILRALEAHGLRCGGRPQFLLTPAELGDVALLLVCDACCASLDLCCPPT